MLTEAELRSLYENLHKLPARDQADLLAALDELEQRNRRAKAQQSLLDFVLYLDSTYKVGSHHKHLASVLEDMAYGRKSRAIVNIAPRFGKSQLTSVYFPAWFIGNFPDKKIMLVSHTADLAVDFGRKVRNIINSAEYKEIFADTTLASDSKSAGRWNTNKGGEFFACGVGGAIAGRGADLLVVDDPHNEQDVLNGNFEVFDKAYQWYTYGARTRLMPKGRVAMVMCMTGDTPVLLANGTERRLDAIRAGDVVASYKNGVLVPARVNNWQLSCIDKVFEIRTTCGIMVRANERHPFLVHRNREPQWIRLKHLQPGDLLVSLKDATAPELQKQNPAYATLAEQKSRGIKSTLTRRTKDLITGAKIKAKHALKKIATSLRTLKECAGRITTDINGPLDSTNALLNEIEPRASKTAMALPLMNTKNGAPRKTTYAQYAATHPATTILERIGTASCVSTTATKPTQFVDCCATTVTSLSDTEKRQKFLNAPLDTFGFTLRKIESITFAGEEPVYDVEVAETENFIANGLVSHNTRWHQADLSGRLLQDMVRKPDGDQWDVIEFPAIFDGDPPRSLWPDQWPVEELLKTRAGMPPFQWSAQYMQKPTSGEASIVRRDWWQKWEEDDPPACNYIIMSMDTASETKTRSDYTSISTWGVFQRDGADGYPESHIILLNAIKERFEFPALKRRALEEYKLWEPDWFLVEKKSSGVQLYQELRAIGVPIQEYTPHKGTGDKVARLNSVTDIISSGLVWYPVGRRWAEDLVDEVCGFPAMQHDDQVDSTIMALLRFRNGGFIRLPSDYYDDRDFVPRRAAYY